jgi:stage V sporulation protein R
MKSITYKDIARLQPEVEKIAAGYGLDFFSIIFELVDYDTMSQLAAYGGFPVRYPHWRFGMEYDQLSKGYRYGLQKIYEMVINTNPCYAYLMKSNPMVDQKLVIAHVYAHCDFFKNNYYFSHTNRKMIDEMANHAIRIRRYIDLYGLENVENFIDTCLSLENLIDYHSPYIKRKLDPKAAARDETPRTVKKLRSKRYMEKYINPPDFIEAQMKELHEKKKDRLAIPEKPERDVLLFLMENAPLENWQHDVLEIIREESYYFSPQGMTKIMNEGWATYWHSTMLTEKLLHPSEVIDYAEHHSGTIANHPGRLNPYRIGVMLFKDIEERWNKGKFGKEYDECDDFVTKKQWDKKTGLGRKKIFEVRQLYNDINFIDTFLTEQFCREHNLFSFAYNKSNKRYEIESREFKMIKQRLLQNLTNLGQPIISVIDANYQNRGELLLHHQFEDVELDKAYAADTLRNLNNIWKRPVYIETLLEEKPAILSFNGTEFKQARFSDN